MRRLVSSAIWMGAAVMVLLAAGILPASGATIFVSTTGDDGHDGSTWALAKATVQAGLDAAQPGDDVWVETGTYVENITLALEVELYGGFAGTEDPGTCDLADRDFDANETILESAGNYPVNTVVTSPAGATTATRIDGFTITGGMGTVVFDKFGPFGGGVLCENSSPTIANNKITDNMAGQPADLAGGGAGIYCMSSSPMIVNNTIIDNISNPESGSGGGILCEDSSPTIVGNEIASNNAPSGGGIACIAGSPAITDNRITGNSATYGAGGGINCSGSAPSIIGNLIADNTSTAGGAGITAWGSTSTIEDNTIAGNQVVTSWGGGAGICFRSETGTVTNNLIVSNWSDGPGGGIYCYFQSSPTIARNTIAGNYTASVGGGIYCRESSSTMMLSNAIWGNSASSGGGIYCRECSPTVTNSTIAGNTAVSGGGIHSFQSSPTIANTIIAFNSSGIIHSGGGTGTPTLRYNCVFGNTGYDYFGITDPTGTNGNISADPLFVRLPDPGPDGEWDGVDDDYGDLRLLEGSPCLDAGDNDAVPAGIVIDLAGNPRFQDDPLAPDVGNGTPPIVDMGAYEGSVLEGTLAVSWHSVRTHDQAGEVGIELDASALGQVVTSEPRKGGVRKIEVALLASMPVSSAGTAEAVDLTGGGGAIPVTGQNVIDNGGGSYTLVLEWASGLPDVACYLIDLAGVVTDLTGDTDCVVRVLEGDVAGAPGGDGVVNLIDAAEVKLRGGGQVHIDPSLAPYDDNCDGNINLIDYAEVKQRSANEVACRQRG